MARVLLTGAAGYLGECVAAALTTARIDWEPLPGRLAEITPQSLPHDLVIHCAGALRHRQADLDSVNRLGTAQLLAGLSPNAGIVYASSRGVYAPNESQCLAESATVGATDDYGRSKLAAEKLIRESGRQWLSLRLTTLFGFGMTQPGQSFPTQAAQRWLGGQTVTLHTPDRQHDYLYVHSAARLIAGIAGNSQLGNSVINVAGPPRSLHTTMTSLAEAVSQRTGQIASLMFEPGPAPRAPLLNTDNLRRIFPAFSQPDDVTICNELAAKI